MANKNIPQIRFKGFDGEWEEQELCDTSVCSIDTGCPFDSKDFDENGKYLVITNGNIQDDTTFVNSNDCNRITIDEKSSYHLKKGEILITMDGTVGRSAIVNDYGMVLAQRVGRLKPIINGYFLYYLLNTGNFSKTMIAIGHGGTIKHISLDEIGSYKLRVAKSDKEQTRIASLFTSLDKQISCSEAKLDKLRTIKKTLLKKMFASQGEKTPQIRFKGFDGEWEEKRLGEIANRLTRRNSNNECDLPLTIASQYGLIDQREYFNFRVASSNITNYFLLKKGEFAYNKSTSDGYPWGSIKRLDRYPMGVLSTLYIIFELKNNSVVSDYVVSYYNTKNWYNSVKKIAAEGARNHGLLNISPIEFFTTNIQLPQNKKEQTKIASLFTALDKQISLQEQKIEKLRAIKKTLLKKMFV